MNNFTFKGIRQSNILSDAPKMLENGNKSSLPLCCLKMGVKMKDKINS